jgi:hypothetical protein
VWLFGSVWLFGGYLAVCGYLAIWLIRYLAIWQCGKTVWQNSVTVMNRWFSALDPLGESRLVVFLFAVCFFCSVAIFAISPQFGSVSMWKCGSVAVWHWAICRFLQFFCCCLGTWVKKLLSQFFFFFFFFFFSVLRRRNSIPYPFNP